MKSTYSVSNNSNNNNNNKGDQNVPDIESEHRPEAGKFRTYLPQILASTAKNLLLMDLGLAIAFPTIVIPALRRIQNVDVNEALYFSPEQASWFGSIAFICQPIGSIISGWVSEPIGRKKAMILVNIPHIIAWLMLHFATTLEEMYIASILLGLGVGFMEAPIVTYIGEICQPSIRGILTSCAGVAAQLGFFIVFLCGTSMTWRNAALVCLSVPIVTVIAIYLVPETPLWLLSKNRKDDALKSLQWLRGWVSPAAVEREFQEIQRYSESSNRCVVCQKANTICKHPPQMLREKFQELLRKRTLKPFFLIIGCFVITQFTGLFAMRPYIVQIFQAYGTPMDPNWATVIFGSVALVANIICMCIIRVVGKRKLAIFSMAGSAVCLITLGFYAFYVLPPGWSSFDRHDLSDIPEHSSVFPMIIFFCLAFFNSVGVTPIPWMLLSEVFPFKTRGIASGIAAAFNYIIAFVTTKTYLDLEKALSMYGVVWFYGVVAIIGVFAYYFLLPETENISLEDIEIHFSENNRKLTDVKIKQTVISPAKKRKSNIESIELASSTNSINNNVGHHSCDNLGYNSN